MMMRPSTTWTLGPLLVAVSLAVSGCTLLDGIGLGDALDGDAPPRFELPGDFGQTGADADADATEVSGLDDCGLTAQEAEEIALTNAARAQAGVAPVVCDPLLVEAARAHSNDMCARDYFEHESPEGLHVGDRLRAAGADFVFAGENIGWGYQSASSVHEGWMTSPGHRDNLLNPDFDRIGVAVDPCGGDAPYWTQVFTAR